MAVRKDPAQQSIDSCSSHASFIGKVWYLLTGWPVWAVKAPIDLVLGCSAILPGQLVATVAAHQLPELSELSQRKVFYCSDGSPCTYRDTFGPWCISKSISTNPRGPRPRKQYVAPLTETYAPSEVIVALIFYRVHSVCSLQYTADCLLNNHLLNKSVY